MAPISAALIAQSFLAHVPAELQREVLADGRALSVPAGAELIPRERPAGIALVLDGLIRIYLQSSRFRQVTVHYARPGETLGLVHLFSRRFDVHAQAMTAATLWTVDAKRLRRLAEKHPSLAMAVAEECAERVEDTMGEMALLGFGSIRQRVARHLLDLAVHRRDPERLIAPVTQKELADATGSVREVVARALKTLHDEGITRSARDGVVIVDARRLDDEVTREGTER